jgi:Domian of unknown function (DUF4952)
MKYLFLITSFFLLTAFVDKPLKCGNLLEEYEGNPKNIEFLECSVGTGQTILEAKYIVSGEHSEEIEKFLIEKYAIGKLKFTCCGWESINGQNGYVENEELKKMNSDYILEISMFGNAEKENEEGEIYLERDRTKIDFYVTVKVLDV